MPAIIIHCSPQTCPRLEHLVEPFYDGQNVIFQQPTTLLVPCHVPVSGVVLLYFSVQHPQPGASLDINIATEHDLLQRVAHRGRNDTISLCCQIEATASPDTVLIFMDLLCGWLAGVRRSKQIHPAIIIHIATPNEQQ